MSKQGSCSCGDGVIEKIETVHADIRVVRIRPAGALVPWVAGQYMTLTFAGHAPRPYSIASAPHAGVLEFHIRRAGPGGAGQYVADTAQPGDRVSLCPPAGRAALAPGESRPLLLVAGGMGVAPMKAIVEDALHRGEARPITLYWGVRTDAELYLRAEFTALETQLPSFRFVPVVGTPVSAVLAPSGSNFADTCVYMAGPPAMVQASMGVLLANGADAGLLYSDDGTALQAGAANCPRGCGNGTPLKKGAAP